MAKTSLHTHTAVARLAAYLALATLSCLYTTRWRHGLNVLYILCYFLVFILLQHLKQNTETFCSVMQGWCCNKHTFYQIQCFCHFSIVLKLMHLISTLFNVCQSVVCVLCGISCGFQECQSIRWCYYELYETGWCSEADWIVCFCLVLTWRDREACSSYCRTGY